MAIQIGGKEFDEATVQNMIDAGLLGTGAKHDTSSSTPMPVSGGRPPHPSAGIMMAVMASPMHKAAALRAMAVDSCFMGTSSPKVRAKNQFLTLLRGRMRSGFNFLQIILNPPDRGRQTTPDGHVATPVFGYAERTFSGSDHENKKIDSGLRIGRLELERPGTANH